MAAERLRQQCNVAGALADVPALQRYGGNYFSFILLGYAPLEAEQMLDGLDPGDDAQALVAEALRRAE